MAANDVKLLGTWASPFVLRAQIALNIKSINYEFIEENLINKSELLLKSNPVHQKVPVLIHGEKPICESLIILQYIDEAWKNGPSILPSDPYDRAIAHFWAAYIDDTWSASLRGALTAQGEEARKAALEHVAEGLALLEDAYKRRNYNGEIFFGGDKIGYLDIAFGSLLEWLKVIGQMNNVKLLDDIKTPHLHQWAQVFCADHAVKDFMPETDKLLEYAKELFMTKFRASSQNKIGLP